MTKFEEQYYYDIHRIANSLELMTAISKKKNKEISSDLKNLYKEFYRIRMQVQDDSKQLTKKDKLNWVLGMISAYDHAMLTMEIMFEGIKEECGLQ